MGVVSPSPAQMGTALVKAMRTRVLLKCRHSPFPILHNTPIQRISVVIWEEKLNLMPCYLVALIFATKKIITKTGFDIHPVATKQRQRDLSFFLFSFTLVPSSRSFHCINETESMQRCFNCSYRNHNFNVVVGCFSTKISAFVRCMSCADLLQLRILVQVLQENVLKQVC